MLPPLKNKPSLLSPCDQATLFSFFFSMKLTIIISVESLLVLCTVLTFLTDVLKSS